MAERTLNLIQVSVIKDLTNIYPTGCLQWVNCDVQIIGDYRVAIEISNGTCGPLTDIGTVYPATEVLPFANVLVTKVRDKDKGYLYIDKASFDANIGDCNGCCEPVNDLAQPQNFTATPGNTQLVLNWDDVPNATGYVLERSANSNFSSPTTVYTGSISGYTNTGLTNGTTYYYRVHAIAEGYDDSPYAYVNGTPVAP